MKMHQRDTFLPVHTTLFKQSEAYANLDRFICQLSHLATGVKIGEIRQKYEPSMSESDEMQKRKRPFDRINSSRKNWKKKFWTNEKKEKTEEELLLEEMVQSEEYEWKWKELSAYWRESFGNRTRTTMVRDTR